MLDLAADPQQVGVVAGQADDPAVRGRRRRVDQEVAVGDAARERGQGELAAGQLGHALQRRDQLVAQLAVQRLVRRFAGARLDSSSVRTRDGAAARSPGRRSSLAVRRAARSRARRSIASPVATSASMSSASGRAGRRGSR